MNESIIIPESFKLNSIKIVVIVDDDYCNSYGYHGEADFTEKAITLCNRFKGKKLTKKEREHTYYHELVHMILDSMGHDRLKFDEKFVDLFAQRLYEYEKTKQ